MKSLFVWAVFCIALSSFCYAAPPTISSFTPVSATPGMTITVTGSNFSTATQVTVGGVIAGFTIVSNTSITLTVPVSTSGSIVVTNPDGSASQTGFIYIPTSGMITDYNGFWSTTAASANSVLPDNSHHLLAFTHNNVTYSTGVNDARLTIQGVSYTPAVFKALPVAGISGVTTGGGSVYLALAKYVDGSEVANVGGVSDYTIKKALTDGINGLDMGTGITNLPTSATMTFQIYNIDPARVADAEPDIILTQIADPTSTNDAFAFLDASGNIVQGSHSFMQNMNHLPELGRYALDLFSMATGIPYNIARPYSPFSSSPTRGLRLISLKLSDFGITAGNASQVRALRITPSGTSDYAFIAYNAASINLPPNASLSPETSTLRVCPGGTASLEVVGTPAAGGALSYTWEESTDNGTTWTSVSNGGNYSGATTSRLQIANATVGHRYRATVHEAGNGNAGISGSLTIATATGTPPSSVSISNSEGNACRNASRLFSSTVTGGSGDRAFQWRSRTGSDPFTDIPGANSAYYVPATDITGTTDYRLIVSNGGGCTATTSNTLTFQVTGVASLTPAERCESGQVTLGATASSGNITWFTAESGGNSIHTGNTYTTPSLTATTTYYVAAAGCASRLPVTATIRPASTAGSISGDGEVEAGNNSTILTLMSQVGDVVKWQSSIDTFQANIQDITHTASQLTVTNITTATQYRTVVQSGSCSQTTSGIAYMRIAGALPIRNSSLQLIRQEGAVTVKWESYDQLQVVSYTIEKSVDGDYFAPATTLPVQAGNNAQYEWTDRSPGEGILYYRIKEVNADGTYFYSSIVSIRLEGAKERISVYPNPAYGYNFNLQLSSVQAGKYRVTLHNTNGQPVYRQQVTHTGSASAHILQLNKSLPKGMYWIKVEGPNRFYKQLPVVVL